MRFLYSYNPGGHLPLPHLKQPVYNFPQHGKTQHHGPSMFTCVTSSTNGYQYSDGEMQAQRGKSSA